MEFNPLKYLTTKRIINVIQILTSYSLSLLLKKPVIYGKPFTFSIEPTNLCNLKCPECPSGSGELTRPAGMMGLENFKRIIDEIKDHAFYIQLFLQGEPYLNKQLPEMITYARSKGIYTAISTNGHAITSKNIDHILLNCPDKLIFSLDAIDQEHYQQYRLGGSFNNADENLRLLISKKKENGLRIPFIELQFIVMRNNEYQLAKFVEYGKNIGVDKISFKSMQISSMESAKQFLPSIGKYSRYIIKDGELKIKNKLKNKCLAIWRTSVITWDGKVIACCFDKDAGFFFGNINDKPFSEIWNSDDYNLFRNQILHSRKEIGMCKNCTEGLNLRMKNV